MRLLRESGISPFLFGLVVGLLIMGMASRKVSSQTDRTSNLNGTTRYAIGGGGESGTFVLDTKTGQVWYREVRGLSIDCGTNIKPQLDTILADKLKPEKGSKETK